MNYPNKQYIAVTGVVLIFVMLAWVYLTMMTVDMAQHMDMGRLGPGMGALEQILNTLFACGSDCLAQIKKGSFSLLLPQGHMMVGYHPWSIGDLWMILIMWMLMVVAMMLPTVIPAIKALNDINYAAAKKNVDAAPLSGFILGYLITWGAVSIVAGLSQWGLQQTSYMSGAMKSSSMIFSGLVLLIAGIYQLSPIKEKCLTQCRMPMTFFIVNWRAMFSGAVRMGIHHGLICAGCCIALMAIMFVVGLMNLVWIALLGIVMLVEKVIPAGKSFANYGGVLLICWGGYYIYLSTIS